MEKRKIEGLLIPIKKLVVQILNISITGFGQPFFGGVLDLKIKNSDFILYGKMLSFSLADQEFSYGYEGLWG